MATLLTTILILLLSLISQNTIVQGQSSHDPILIAAEKGAKVIKVQQDGSGDFKTMTDAINNIPAGNKVRTILNIGPGVYKEKITVDRTKPFITFYGSPNAIPTLTFDGDALKYGTVNSASVIIESDYFVAANIIFQNTSPEPGVAKKGGQASAMRISGDKATFYNCKFKGFQDTLCDDKGLHYFKDCYVEGTIDFIFGNGKSLYSTTELHSVAKAKDLAAITAQARKNTEDTGFSFVDCKITGTGDIFLGRTSFAGAKVVFANTFMSSNVNPAGWRNDHDLSNDKTVYYGEYKCSGPGAKTGTRPPYVKMLTDAEAKPYMDISFINGPEWILPVPKL